MQTNDDYLQYLLNHPPVQRRRRVGCADVLFFVIVGGMLLLGLALKGPELLVTYGLVSVETMTDLLHVDAAPQPHAQDTPRPPVAAPVVVPVARPALPACSQVRDTTTLCQPDAPAPVQAIEQLPTEAPAPTTTPAYMTACITEPGQSPCWAPDAPAPLPLPETPIVLLPAPPSVDVCAMWHPPLPWPEGCEE